MTQDINVLYNGGMTRLIKQDYDFGSINHDAEQLAKSEGSAVVIRVRHGLPDIAFSTIYVLRYSKEEPHKPKSESLEVPVSALELIANTCRK